MAEFALKAYHAEQGVVEVAVANVSVELLPQLGEQLVGYLDARIVDQQQDADLHTWLVDFEGTQLFLKVEHYSESVWFEALAPQSAQEELAFIAQLLQRNQ